MKLIEDKNQKPDKHIEKNRYWKSKGVEVMRYRLPVGDYILVDEKVQDVIDRKSKRGIDVKQMDFLGTYSVTVDTKNSIDELLGDIVGKSHERFRDECILAQNNGIKLVILVEDDGGYVDKKQTIYNKPVRSLDGLFSWKNPRLFIMQNGRQKYPKATRGKTLAKALYTMQRKYGIDIRFCSSKDAGQKVIDILEEYGNGIKSNNSTCNSATNPNN